MWGIDAMFIRKKEIEGLSADIRRIIGGQRVDLRDNREGRLSILKNDIHTLSESLNEQAWNLQKEKSALADTLADISHQLKTPLTAMMVMAELLESAPPPEKAAEFITNLKLGLAQTGWLVNALLKMAKLESGSVVFSPVEISAKELLESALQPLHILLDIKNQRVHFLGEDVLFLCDKNWTAEALTNVIKNASEHSPENAVIHIHAGDNPLYKWLSVTDSGKGIPYTEIKSLFRRFGTGRVFSPDSGREQNMGKQNTECVTEIQGIKEQGAGKQSTEYVMEKQCAKEQGTKYITEIQGTKKQGTNYVTEKQCAKEQGTTKQSTGIGLPLALAILRGQNGDIEVDGGGGTKGASFTFKFYR